MTKYTKKTRVGLWDQSTILKVVWGVTPCRSPYGFNSKFYQHFQQIYCPGIL